MASLARTETEKAAALATDHDTGLRLQQLFDDPAVMKWFSDLRSTLVELNLDCKPNDDEGRRAYAFSAKTLDRLVSFLKAAPRAGFRAGEALAKLREKENAE